MTDKQRIAELERRIRELEARPKVEQHNHYHYSQPVMAPTYPTYPTYPPWPTYTLTPYMNLSGSAGALGVITS